MVPDIGREVAAFGIGLDVAGAVFLGLGLLKSPMFAASVLYADASYAGKRAISTLPLSEMVASMLEGRVGVVALVLGFALQLAGLVLPSRQGTTWLPLALAPLATMAARMLGNRWIARHHLQLTEEITHSGRITAVIHDREQQFRSPRTTPAWREPWLVRDIQRYGGPR